MIRTSYELQALLAEWPNLKILLYDTAKNKSVEFDVALRTVKGHLPEEPPALILYPLKDLKP